MINTNTLKLDSLVPGTLRENRFSSEGFRSGHQSQWVKESVQDRYGLSISARLSDSTSQLPHDISERLRAARMHALGKRKVINVRTASSVIRSGGAAAMTMGDTFGDPFKESSGDEKFSLWNAIASALPLIALIVGLVSINIIQNNDRAGEVAEIDAALLTDDLPPTAYTDPGFVQFLKARRDLAQ